MRNDDSTTPATADPSGVAGQGEPRLAGPAGLPSAAPRGDAAALQVMANGDPPSLTLWGADE